MSAKHRNTELFYKDNEHKTIEVRGFQAETSDDTLKCYFENPKKGGGEIADFLRLDDDKVAYITFADAQVAKNIVGQPHKIDNVGLRVQLINQPAEQKPLLLYSDRLLISGINESTTKDCLINYLETRSDCDIADNNIVFGDKKGHAVVIFDQIPDVEKLQEKCAKKSLEGSQLTVSQIPVNPVMIVRGLSENTDEETLCNYFEGKRSGNVAGVEVDKVKMMFDEGYCLVYFKDYSVIEQILTVDKDKGHRLNDAHLDVSVFYECLFVKREDDKLFNRPAPLLSQNWTDIAEKTLQNLETITKNALFSRTLKFDLGIQHFMQQFCQTEINQIMSDLKGLLVQIEYTSVGNEFVVTATKKGISSAVKRLGDLASTVKQKNHTHKRPGITKVLQSQRGIQFIAGLEQRERCIIQVKCNSSTKISEEKPQMFHEMVESSHVTDTNQLEFENENSVEHSVQGDSGVHTDAGLSCDQKPSRRNRIFNHPSMATAQFGECCHESKDVSEVNRQIGRYDDISAISLCYFSDEIHHAEQCIQFIEKFFAEETTEKKLEDKTLKILNSSQCKRILSLENTYQVKMILQQEIGQVCIQGCHQDVSDAFDVVISILREADHFKSECEKAAILSNQAQWYFTDKEQETLIKYDKDVNGTIEKAHYDGFPTVSLQAGSFKYIIDFQSMEEYLADNKYDSVKVVRESLIKDSKMKTTEVKSLHYEAMKRLLKEDLFVDIKLGHDKTSSTFEKDETREIQNRTEELIRENINTETFSLKQEEIKSVVNSLQDSTQDVYCAYIPQQNMVAVFSEDRNLLEEVKRKLQIKLELKKPRGQAGQIFTSSKTVSSEQKNQATSSIQNVSTSTSTKSSVEPLVKGKHVDVMVYKGNITQLSVEAVVNAANGRLDHGAGVARAIADAAGEDLVKEGNKFVREQGQIAVTGVAVTTAGRLPYHCVLHAVGPAYYDYKDKSECLEDLCKTILRCLCEARKQNLKSVAIPSISSGIYGVPKESCAEMYVRAVMSFNSVVSGGSLKEVHFVDISDNMLQLISNEFITKWDTKLDEEVLERDKRFIEEHLLASKAISAKDVNAAAAGDKNHSTTSTDKCGIQVIVYQEDIFNFDCDAVVCWKDPSFTPVDYAKARAIYQHADYNYKQRLNEIKRKYTYQQRNKKVFTAFAKKGVLVIHGIIDPRCPSVTDFQDVLTEIIEISDQEKLQSITLPVFHAFTSDSVKKFTEVLCQSVKDFIAKKKDHSLKRIHVVDTDDKVVSFVNTLVENSGVNVWASCSETDVYKNESSPAQHAPSQHSDHVNDVCTICRDEMSNALKLKKCGHSFCKDCIDTQMKYKPVCPSCGMLYGVLTGNMPTGGTMRVDYNKSGGLPGYEKCGFYRITYSFPGGRQTKEHPDEGQWYKGITRYAYLPDTLKGRKILAMLRVAWERRLTFTIRRSVKTGRDGIIIWNDIHHKTNISGDKFGYPDPGYLDRVEEKLSAKGITEESIKDPKYKTLTGTF